MWNLKCKIIPVIIGGTGIVTKVLRKNLEVTSGKHSIDSLPKTAVLGTHIIRKTLRSETSKLTRRINRNIKKKRPVTRDNNNNDKTTT
jgi:hypothetical protein